MSLLPNPQVVHDILSGRRGGPAYASLRAALLAAEAPYSWVVRHRNRRYDARPERVVRVDVPVVGVGNLTVGGTGKTPMVEWLVRRLAAQGVRAGIVSRGYGASSAGLNDEGRELALKLPDTPHVQNRDRAAAAREAIARCGCQAIVLDDGFQHRRLGRDLDLVLLDAIEPFGYGHLLPRGLLREPIEGLRRAQAVVLSRADVVDASARDAIRQRVAAVHPAAVWLEAVHAPRGLIDATGRRGEIDLLRGRRLAAFCAIGNPAGFRHTLARCGYEVAAWRELPDHDAFVPTTIDALERWIDASGADAIACTLKDLVKLNRREMAGRPVWAVEIGIEFLGSSKPLDDLLAACMERRKT